MNNTSLRHFDLDYQKKVGKNARELLHLNSKELVKFFSENVDLSLVKSLLEIGAGACRNIKYFRDEFPDIEYSASDLYFNEAEFYDEILELVNSGEIEFHNLDTLELCKNLNFYYVDAIVFSDHLMHLNSKVVDYVMTKVLDWSPTYVLMREQKKGYDTSGKNYHESYSRLATKYELVNQIDSAQDSKFFIQLWKKR